MQHLFAFYLVNAVVVVVVMLTYFFDNSTTFHIPTDDLRDFFKFPSYFFECDGISGDLLI